MIKDLWFGMLGLGSIRSNTFKVLSIKHGSVFKSQNMVSKIFKGEYLVNVVVQNVRSVSLRSENNYWTIVVTHSG